MKRVFLIVICLFALFSIQIEANAVFEVNFLEELHTEIESAEGLVFVNCYSPLCHYCKLLDPQYTQFAIDLGDRGKFLRVNAKKVPQIRSFYGVRGMPTLLIFENNQLKEKVIGLQYITFYLENLKYHW